jgi:hypothetical protein
MISVIPTAAEPELQRPEPEAGLSAVSGRLTMASGGGPIPGTVFYLLLLGEDVNLEPAVYAPDVSRGDVRAMTDDAGAFVLNDVPPGDYRLLVWAPYSWIEAQASENDVSPLVLRLEAEGILELGTVYVPWP